MSTQSYKPIYSPLSRWNNKGMPTTWFVIFWNEEVSSEVVIKRSRAYHQNGLAWWAEL